MKKLINILIVNLITMIRIVGVFLIIPTFKYCGGIMAANLSIACYLTDVLDGYLARKNNASTFFGSIFDGIADKLFTITNLILLIKITKLALIPILFEICIIIIQTVKYSNNINVQSSLVGKIKTWIIGINVIIFYLLSDIYQISIISDTMINFIVINKELIIYLIITVLYIFEILTLISYLIFKQKNIKETEYKNINIKLRNAKSINDYFYNFNEVWLNHDFYINYKDCAELKDIYRYLKNNR